MSDDESANRLRPQVMTERELVAQVLKKYKRLPCLWDTSNEQYYNKSCRNAGYNELLKIWRQYNPHDDMTNLKKKIDHYRAVYRRERRKVENSVISEVNPEKIYEPTLWYYKLLTFLDNKSDTSFSDEEIEQEIILPSQKKMKMSAPSQAETNNDIPKTIKDQKAHGPVEKNIPSIKKRIDPDYFTLYGQTIATQLSELDDHVRYEAERIISDVIYRARTGTLRTYYGHAGGDSIVIPQSGPSWYDIATASEAPTARLIVTVDNDDIIKTELE